MTQRSQLDHHLYSTGFDLDPSSVERWLEYQWAAEQSHGRHVMDLGCNTGYGSDLIARRAASVLGTDVV